MSGTIGFMGMTHLGICSAVAAASKGFETLCFDRDPDLVGRLGQGALPVSEPDLDGLFASCADRLSFTTDSPRLASCDVIYVAPDVPTDDKGVADLAPLESLLSIAFAAARPDAVIVILSQVPPGFTRGQLQPGRIVHYQVETLVFGRAVERATRPERFILGCVDPAAPLPPAWRGFLEAFGCPLLPMRLESAELAKIAINCFLVASVTTTNTLAEICERIGADWSEIAPALRLDRRIGEHAYLVPGLGLAGGNLERDLATVLALSGEYGSEAGLVRAFLGNSRHRRYWVLGLLHDEILDRMPGARLGVLGLAYKENTHSVKNSPSLALIRDLAPWPLSVFDPVVPPSAAPHPAVTGASSALEAARGTDALAIMTPWPEFRTLSCADLRAVMRGRLVVDPYRVLDPRAARAAGLDHRTLGTAAAC